MYDILKTSTKGRLDFSLYNPSIENSDSDPHDPWLFTDPNARDAYAQHNRLDQLESDVSTYAMYEGCWAPDELELKRELHRLLHSHSLIPKGTFCYLSPHPTVYRAVSTGTLEVCGQKYHFAPGDEVVFVPWLARVSRPGLSGPVHIGRLQSISRLCLCCEAFPVIGSFCERALAILHQTLPRQAKSHPN